MSQSSERKYQSALLAPTLQIQRSFVTQKVAFLGTSGSGKTYGAGLLVEGLIEIGGQVVIIDTVGNWWGLRFARDGVGPGLKIPILGGDYGDLPLQPTHGAEIAETVANTIDSMIIDVSDFEDGELRRFVTQFAKTLLRAKKRSPGPVMIVWEECQDVIPQTMFGDDAKMVGAVQRLIKRGRNYGIGTALISQRTAAVNKGCLNQIETLFAFRTTAPLDRKAISDWTDHVGAEPVATARGQNRPQRLTDRLHELATGACIVYSPHVLERLEILKFNEKRTFDASKTPDDEDEAFPVRVLPPVNLTELKKRLDLVVQEAKENDVASLKMRIKELEARDATFMGATGADVNAEIAALTQERNKLRDEGDALRFSLFQCQQSLTTANQALQHIAKLAGDATSVELAAENERALQRDARMVAMQHKPRITSATLCELDRTTEQATPTSGALTDRQRIILTAIAQHPSGLTAKQIQTHTGYAASGKMSDTYTMFVRAGWVTRADGTFTITKAGLKKLGAFKPLPTGAALFAQLQQSPKLEAREKKILEIARRYWPNPVSKGEIVKLSGWAASGKMSDSFTSLTTMGYLKKAGAGKVVLGEALVG